MECFFDKVALLLSALHTASSLLSMCARNLQLACSLHAGFYTVVQKKRANFGGL